MQNLLQGWQITRACISEPLSTPSATFYVSINDETIHDQKSPLTISNNNNDDDEELFFEQFGEVRRQIEATVTALLSPNLTDEEQLTLFAEAMKTVALCTDFNANHIAFLDTIWNRSREAVHQRNKSLQRYDANSQNIRLSIETDLLYKEMRAELLEIVKRRKAPQSPTL